MTASEHRAKARSALQNNWLWAVITTLIASLLGGLERSGGIDLNIELPEDFSGSMNFEEGLQSAMPEISDLPITSDVLDLPELQELLTGSLGIAIAVAAVIAIVVALAVSVVMMLIGGSVGLGYRKYMLNLLDGKPAEFTQIFSQFNRLGVAFRLRLLQALIGLAPVLIWLVACATMWMMMGEMGAYLGLPALFAVIALAAVISYGLSMAEYILAEDETCTAMDALRRSWTLMDGHKWRYFCLGMSFIGWSILAGFTFGIGGLFLNPYQQAAYTSFYRELCPDQRRYQWADPPAYPNDALPEGYYRYDTPEE